MIAAARRGRRRRGDEIEPGRPIKIQGPQGRQFGGEVHQGGVARRRRPAEGRRLNQTPSATTALCPRGPQPGVDPGAEAIRGEQRGRAGEKRPFPFLESSGRAPGR